MTDERNWMRTRENEPLDLHTERPHAARVYDVLLGGKTNYAADREAAEHLVAVMPNARRTAWENRAFMRRSAALLARSGVRQFLDIGTGIPTSPNLHEVVQEIDPAARVVYADNDPIVLAHSRALHNGTPQGRTAYLHGDLRDPASILEHPELIDTLDLTEPVAVTLLTVLHWLSDEPDPYAIVREVMAAVPSGSHLVISHITTDLDAQSVGAASSGLNAKGSTTTPRSKERVREFFAGLELLEPGLEFVERWRPEATDPQVTEIGSGSNGDIVPVYVGVARKP